VGEFRVLMEIPAQGGQLSGQVLRPGFDFF
jgi:hypothetical protein